ncbi:MAG: ABC transporter substrate-binding protein [Anaerolineales bacterium]|nr:ABC transporter substrate-binding protein [Anaerolineales bacterium]
MKHKKMLLLLLSLLLSSCAARSTSEEPDTLTFMAGYKPQANLPFVGVYVAQEMGFFTEENLLVRIEHSAGGGEHLQLLAAGDVQVTTQDAAVMLQRRADPGIPLVSIALIGQRGQQAFAALKTSGLETPADWEGRLVGFKGTPPPDLYLLLEKAGVNPDLIELVNVGFDPRVLSEGQVDVYPVYNSNEPWLLQSWGYELTIWHPADYNVPSLGLAYVTSEDILDQDPDKLSRFLRAALRGIAYAEENPDEAIDIVLLYTGDSANRDHMRFMLETELVDAHNGLLADQPVGTQTLEQWQNLASMLEQTDLPVPENLEAAFTTSILDQALH